jgi:hypothetical protein
LVRKATLLIGLGSLAAGTALAGVPSSFDLRGETAPPSNVIRVAQLRTNQPDPGSLNGVQATTRIDQRAITIVTVYDAGLNRVPNSTVVIDFSACSDFRLCASQTENPVFTCAPPRVTAVTDANGEARFRIAGGFTGGPPISATLPAAGAGLDCATITADNQAIGVATVAGPDLNNSGSAGGAPSTIYTIQDISILISDLNRQNGGGPGASVRGRSNLDGSVAVTPIAIPDQAILLQYINDTNKPPGAAAGSPNGCTPNC